MKRSTSLRLVLMGSAALTLIACDESVDVGVFETVEQCTVMGYSESACETAIASAKKEHLESAPRYATKADCEAEFGRCESPEMAVAEAKSAESANPTQPPAQTQSQPAPQTAYAGGGFGSYFMPMMTGYMIGRMMSGSSAMAQPLYRPVGETARAAGGTGYYTGNGTRVAGATGLARMPESVFTAAARTPTSTLSRGGFGTRAQSISVAS